MDLICDIALHQMYKRVDIKKESFEMLGMLVHTFRVSFGVNDLEFDRLDGDTPRAPALLYQRMIYGYTD